MIWVRSLRTRLHHLFARGAFESRMNEEFTLHIELETERLMKEEGLKAAEARRRATISFGGTEKHRESVRDARTLSWLPKISLDLKLGGRLLAKYPAINVVAGLSLAFAIAVCATTFEFVTQVMFPQLPIRDGDRVVAFQMNVLSGGEQAAAEGLTQQTTVEDFAAWRDGLRSVTEIGAYRSTWASLSGGDGTAALVEMAEMSPSGFELAGVAPIHGRYLLEEDGRSGAPPVVVLGHDVWQARFSGDPSIVGRQVQLGEEEATVVGVMPQGFGFPYSHSAWIPLKTGELATQAGEQVVQIFARLSPGISLREAQAELSAFGVPRAASLPGGSAFRPEVRPYAQAELLRERGVGYAINASLILFLLLISANVSLLIFTRLAARENEIVVRGALGATRQRIILQLVAEALVLASVAAAAGLAAASFLIKSGFKTMDRLEQVPFWLHATIAPRTVVYTAAMALLCALGAGVLPALKMTGPRMEKALRQRAAGGLTLRFGRFWTGVIVLQVGLAVVCIPMVVDAMADAVEIRNAVRRFPAEEYLTARVSLATTGSTGELLITADELPAKVDALLSELKLRLASEPAVIGVTTSTAPGMSSERRVFELENAQPPEYVQRVTIAQVDDRFFDVLQAPIVAGRGFHPGRAESDNDVVVVNQSFVQTYLRGRNAVGQRLRYLDDGPGPWQEIVGVATDIEMSLNPDIPGNEGVYHPIRDPVRITSGGATPTLRQLSVLTMHIRGNAEAFAPRLNAIAASIDPAAIVFGVQRLDELQTESLTTRIWWVQVAAVGSALLLLLAIAGIYSIMSFTVTRRTREVGIRVALGADRLRALRPIFSRALFQITLGLGMGVIVLLFLRDLTNYTIRGGGWLAGALLFVISACLAACVVPTRRALAVEPTIAIRTEG